VLVANADMSVEEEMARVLDHARARFGALNGVFHAAGIATGIKLIADMDERSAREQFGPKVHGLYVLQKVLEGSRLDFCMLFSSTASVLGGMGLCAYTAASLFMDSYACFQNKVNDLPWISVDWDGWLVDDRAWVDHEVQTSIDEFFMTPDESLEAIKRTLSMNPPGQLIVSTGELSDRIKLWLNRGFMDASSQPEQVGATHERPNLRNEYVAPQTAAEEAIAGILQRLLGIKAVGIHDNFFEMGGDSLLGVKVIGIIKQTFHVNITLRHLWEEPTVAGLALLVEELIIEDLLAASAEEGTQPAD
jgi:phthiocerol/phenolphthiocerol synthesis type-I polyketide synthase E